MNIQILFNLRLWFWKVWLGPDIFGPFRYLLPYNTLFHIAARYHDIAYTRGWDKVVKCKVDEMFLRLMLSVCKNKLQKWFAYIYYYLVKSLGFMFFSYQ